MPRQSRRQVCRLRENRAQQSQLFEGTTRATLQLSQERSQRLALTEETAHEPNVAQSLRLPRIRPQRRIARRAFVRTTKSPRRSMPRQSRRRNASGGEDFGQPWLWRRLCQTPVYSISALDTSTATSNSLPSATKHAK